MSSRPYIVHKVSDIQPAGLQVGDEYYNPIINRLYKVLAINGTTVTASQIWPFISDDDTTTNATYYPVVVTTVGGSTAKTSSGKLYFNPSTGTLSATVFTSLSDITVKDNVETIVNSTDIISKLRGVSFIWKDTGDKSYGVVAQEIEQVLPELVNTSEMGEKSVNYSSIIAFLIESNKELVARIEKLEKR